MIEWLNTNSGAVQAMAMIVLVVVTAIYAWLTRSMASEMQKARFDSLHPDLVICETRSNTTDPFDFRLVQEQRVRFRKPSLNETASGFIRMHIHNFGSGSARNIVVKAYSDNKLVGNRDVLPLGIDYSCSVELPIRFESANDASLSSVVIEYDDLFGRSHTTRTELGKTEGTPSPGSYSLEWAVERVSHVC